MQRMYMDNSATSFPKPEAVSEAMADFARSCGASAGRGAYAEAKACQRLIALCRRRVAELIHAESPERVVFAMNCSEALAIAIRGLLNTAPAGSHAIATAMEHNSVLRAYNALAEQTRLSPQFIPCDGRSGLVDPDAIRRALRPQTRLIACVHVSNVTGTLQPIQAVARIAREADIPCLIDAAQSAGHVEIDVQELGADFVAFPGHKGLLGPLGTGALYIRPGAERKLATMKEGGTGTVSERALQPDTMPDRFEIGSHNAIGLAGLSEGVAWVLERGVASVREHDELLCRQFLASAEGVEHLTVYGPRDVAQRCGVFSVNVDGLAPGELAETLERDFGVCTRPGVHCAPLAHRTIGTHPAGTCRLSFGPFTTLADVAFAAEALAQVAQRRRAGLRPAASGGKAGSMKKRSTDDAMAALKSAPVFSALDAEAARGLLASCQRLSLSAGEHIFWPSEAAERLFVIVAGQVKIYMLSSRGDEQILHLYGPGETFGEAAVWGRINYPAFADAVSDVELLAISRRTLRDLIAGDAEMAMRMLAGLSAKLREFARLIEQLSLKEVPARLATVFLAEADGAGGSTFKLGMTKRQLAARIGTAAETLSRTLGKLKADGLIEVRGSRITLLDLAALADLAENG